MTPHFTPSSNTARSQALWERARKVAPMGAQGEGKYYAPYPHFIERGRGAYVWDADGNTYVDYWNGAGPGVLGHADPVVERRVAETIETQGVVFCAPNALEVELGETLSRIIPCAEMSAFLNAGSDVLYMAARLARAVTGRTILVKFAGSYHGWFEDLLFNVSSYEKPADNRGLYAPLSESIGTNTSAACIRVLDFNDMAAVEQLFETEGDNIAGLVVEPVMHGPLTGCITPLPGFLERLRELCTAHGSLLIFDEILTGFRHHIGGAQALLGVTPDLAAFGKAISNGHPIAALCGPRAVMEQLAPVGRAFFSGTYNGNVASVAAALATIERLSDGSVFAHIAAMGAKLGDGLNAIFDRYGIEANARVFGSVVALHHSNRTLHSFGDVWRHHDMSFASELATFMFDNGLYAKPRKTQRLLVSGAHTAADIDRTLDVFDRFYVGRAAA
ncbi:aspartate aminotransferase family protein [Lichenifustis flavocetrariae]|uniref:Aspartate aminotransferase family protein n=1 Tax=Lichenifustis flavocetrariae TaxID=2949735 RepID=A0AA41YW90_9HYPH|nr:aspartate aminotransferase family protein [Lichenifustis flavocetrariae]MCW6509279.1 aspartate aminotransferase family protein [Lichenifustis flavocetrariae]